MGKSQYQYQPLKENNTIRILTLYPGKQGDPLKGELEAVPIDSTGSYEALSYVWGEPGPLKSEILIRNGNGDEELLVFRTRSIVSAMRHLRLPDRPRRIWADQCCINQDDLEERSKQVQFMNKLYRNAAHVLVWLGLDTEYQAAAAFRLICELHKSLRSHSEDSPSPASNAPKLQTHIRENHEAIQALTDRTWVSDEGYHHH
jgi:hypothetical protein